jgi:hypothetical protein
MRNPIRTRCQALLTRGVTTFMCCMLLSSVTAQMCGNPCGDCDGNGRVNSLDASKAGKADLGLSGLSAVEFATPLYATVAASG